LTAGRNNGLINMIKVIQDDVREKLKSDEVRRGWGSTKETRVVAIGSTHSFLKLMVAGVTLYIVGSYCLR